IVAVELALAAAWLTRRLPLAALGLGVGLHVGIEASGFRIGLLSYVMLALYLLMLPTAGLRLPRRPLPRGAAAITGLGVALVLGAILWAINPVPVSGRVIALSSAVAVGAFVKERTVLPGAAHLAACALALGLGLGTDQAV